MSAKVTTERILVPNGSSGSQRGGKARASLHRPLQPPVILAFSISFQREELKKALLSNHRAGWSSSPEKQRSGRNPTRRFPLPGSSYFLILI